MTSTPGPQGPGASPQPAQPGERAQPPDQDKKHALQLLKRINAALDRKDVKEAAKDYEKNRKRLRGIADGDGDKRMRTNLHYANLAMVRPQVYAKDPEFNVTPTAAVSEEALGAVTAFASTAETVLSHELVKGCKLKKRAKRLIASCYATALGWWKLSWQEDRRTDPVIANRLKDSQDNLAHLQEIRRDLDDQQACADMDAQIAELRQTMAGLQGQAEVVVARGLALDFVLSEDVIVVDESVTEIADYERAEALAHRLWMTCERFEEMFGFKPEKAKRYRERKAGQQQGDTAGDLLCVYELWDQRSNRVYHLCEGVEGYCREPHTPDWTGQRWYPFFLLVWNEVDGGLVPPSDVQLTHELVEEYNTNRDDFVRDRRDTLPFTVVRKGGNLTEGDVKNIRNRDGNNIVVIEGVGNAPLAQDLQAVTLGTLNPANYSTDPSRADIEQLIGGGDAARGTVLKAKTATEAEIMAQGLRGRSSERIDSMEDLLSEVGEYALQVCLRKLTPEEVRRIAGKDAQWPTLSAEQVFEQVAVSVRGGSTGKPDRLQDQDRWTKLQPVIEKTVMTVADLYSRGQTQLGQALVAMLRETLRRFDERIDIDQYLPEAPEDGQPNPALLAQEVQQLKEQLQQAKEEMDKLNDQLDKGYIQAAAQIATSASPLVAGQAFVMAMQALEAMENGEQTPGGQGESIGTEPPMSEPPNQPTAALP